MHLNSFLLLNELKSVSQWTKCPQNTEEMNTDNIKPWNGLRKKCLPGQILFLYLYFEQTINIGLKVFSSTETAYFSLLQNNYYCVHIYKWKSVA